MGYTEACTTTGKTINVATKRDGRGQIGAPEELFWSKEDFAFDSVTAAKDQANWDAGVAAGNLIFIGRVKAEAANTDQTFFEDTGLGLKELDTEAIRSTVYILSECACTHAEISKMSGINGRLLTRSKKGFVDARQDDDGKVRGFLTNEFYVGLKEKAVDGAPRAFTRVTATFEDAEGDDQNPCELKIDFQFKDVDSITRGEFTFNTIGSNGTNLTFNLVAKQGCSDVALSGLVKDNMKVTNTSGVEITTFTISETGSTGVYAVDVTTALETVYIEINGIQNVSDVLYISKSYSVAA